MIEKVIVILGMHRSGTSVISNWLQQCGLNIGGRLAGKGIGNVEGHFEDLDFSEMHEQLLTKRDLPSHGLIDKPIIDLSDEEKNILQELLLEKLSKGIVFGWKDPRTCLFLSFYGKSKEFNFRYIIIVRDFNEVVISLVMRDYKYYEKRTLRGKKYFKRKLWIVLYRKRKITFFLQTRCLEYLKSWITYNEEILNLIQSIPEEEYVLLNIYDNQKDSEKNIHYINQVWGIHLKAINFKSIFNKKYISKKKRIDDYVSEKDLIIKAQNIYNNLMTFKLNIKS